MKWLLEVWHSYITEGEDVKRVSKVVMIDEDDRVLILRRSGKVISKESPSDRDWETSSNHFK